MHSTDTVKYLLKQRGFMPAIKRPVRKPTARSRRERQERRVQILDRASRAAQGAETRLARARDRLAKIMERNRKIEETATAPARMKGLKGEVRDNPVLKFVIKHAISDPVGNAMFREVAEKASRRIYKRSFTEKEFKAWEAFYKALRRFKAGNAGRPINYKRFYQDPKVERALTALEKIYKPKRPIRVAYK
jgi:hypothetical protein